MARARAHPAAMGRLTIPGVCEKNGSYYRRFKIVDPVTGKRRDHYVKLPPPGHPDFAAALERANRKAPTRKEPSKGTMGWLCREKRRLLAADRGLAPATRRDWNYYLDLIETDHGERLVADLRRARCYKLRDDFAQTPGKANAFMAKLKALLELACERDMIAVNPAAGIKRLRIGEHQPWPAPVLERFLGEGCHPVDARAVILHLFTGQRVSDCIAIRRDAPRGGRLVVRSQKTGTTAHIALHPRLVAEIAAIDHDAVTILADTRGRPFATTGTLQARIRRRMKTIGEVDGEGRPLYSLHGLAKNAICHLIELGLTEEEVGAIVGKTPATVRHYAREARRYMLAESAGARVIAADFGLPKKAGGGKASKKVGETR